MLRVIHHHQINKTHWDRCIDQSVMPLPYVYSWYLDIACPGWDAIVNDDYSVVSPVPHRTKFGIKYIYQPFFTQQFGLFATGKQLLESIQSEYYRALSACADFVQYQLHAAHTVWPPTPFCTKTRQTHHLKLSDTYDNLFNQYSENLRRNLKKYKSQLTVKQSNEADVLIRLFRHEKSKEVNVLHDSDYLTLHNLIKAAVQQDKGTVWEVYENNKCIAAAFVLYNDSYVVNILNISDAIGRKKQAMSVLLDGVIQSFSGSPRVFDFEGSDIPGVAAFYRSFGAQSTPYWHITLNQLPWHFRLLKKWKDGLQFRRT